MAAPIVSIRQSLSIPLPQYPYHGPQGTTDLKKGSHTETTHPPMFAITRNPNHPWFLKGQQFLNRLHPRTSQFQGLINSGQISGAWLSRVQEAVSYSNHFSNNGAFLPKFEGNIAHNNEAGVVRTAALYLIHPVAQALWACPDYYKTFASQSEDTSQRTRTT